MAAHGNGPGPSSHMQPCSQALVHPCPHAHTYANKHLKLSMLGSPSRPFLRAEWNSLEDILSIWPTSTSKVTDGRPGCSSPQWDGIAESQQRVLPGLPWPPGQVFRGWKTAAAFWNAAKEKQEHVSEEACPPVRQGGPLVSVNWILNFTEELCLRWTRHGLS